MPHILRTKKWKNVSSTVPYWGNVESSSKASAYFWTRAFLVQIKQTASSAVLLHTSFQICICHLQNGINCGMITQNEDLLHILAFQVYACSRRLPVFYMRSIGAED